MTVLAFGRVSRHFVLSSMVIVTKGIIAKPYFVYRNPMLYVIIFEASCVPMYTLNFV